MRAVFDSRRADSTQAGRTHGPPNPYGNVRTPSDSVCRRSPTPQKSLPSVAWSVDSVEILRGYAADKHRRCEARQEHHRYQAG